MSQIDEVSDKVLLDAIMQDALDCSSVGVSGLGHTPPRRAKLRDLSLKSIDNLRQPLGRATFRHTHTSSRESSVILRRAKSRVRDTGVSLSYGASTRGP